MQVMRGEKAQAASLVYATLLLGHVSLASGPCERGRSWWDPRSGACLACTACDATRHLTVLRPCELHRDTLCVPLQRLGIQWPGRPHRQGGGRASDPQNARQTQNREETPEHPKNDKDNEEANADLGYDYIESETEEDIKNEDKSAIPMWVAQTTALTIATTGCILFFAVVICLSLYHTRQWRRLKRTLERDVQDLSAKLRLVECGPPVQPRRASPPKHHFYCNVPHAGTGKDPLLEGMPNIGFNNVYTLESHTS